MRILAWTVRLAAFLLLAAFAARNIEPVTLRLWFDTALQAPLAVVLFAFFAGGALAGMLALLGPLLRSRRRAARLDKQLAGAQAAPPRH